jgi:hypothetical protein
MATEEKKESKLLVAVKVRKKNREKEQTNKTPTTNNTYIQYTK